MTVEVLIRGPFGPDRWLLDNALTDIGAGSIAAGLNASQQARQFEATIGKLTDVGHITGVIAVLDLPIEAQDTRLKWMEVGSQLSDLAEELSTTGYGSFTVTFLDEVAAEAVPS